MIIFLINTLIIFTLNNLKYLPFKKELTLEFTRTKTSTEEWDILEALTFLLGVQVEIK